LDRLTGKVYAHLLHAVHGVKHEVDNWCAVAAEVKVSECRRLSSHLKFYPHTYWFNHLSPTESFHLLLNADHFKQCVAGGINKMATAAAA